MPGSANEANEILKACMAADLESMFYDASALNADLDKWHVSEVMDMNGMFWCASAFNADLSKWEESLC